MPEELGESLPAEVVEWVKETMMETTLVG